MALKLLSLILGLLIISPDGIAETLPEVFFHENYVDFLENQAEAEIVSFLAMLQERGRLVDFRMDDITAYGDAQVGAAARVVHNGCKAALREHFKIGPIREESEGSSVTVTAGFAADEYRFVGKISGEPPFSGTLVHCGWKTQSVKLPRVIAVGGNRLPTIAPAEVELK